MKDFALDLDPTSPSYGDLLIENHGFKVTSEAEYIRQKLRIKLKFVYGEWFLNTIVGVKYYENILVKNPNMSTIESIFKAAILSSYGVVEITDFNLTFDKATRSLSINCTVDASTGSPLTINEKLP